MLKSVVATNVNRTTLLTWPFLEGALIEDGYDLAFSSKYTNEGSIPDKPLLTWIPPGKSQYDWETVSPPNWDGTTEVVHLGKVVFKPSGNAAAVDVGAFKNSFWNMQDNLVNSIQANKVAIGLGFIGIISLYFLLR